MSATVSSKPVGSMAAGARAVVQRELRLWGVSVLLLLPLLLTYGAHMQSGVSGAPSWAVVQPAGFLHIDMPAYMANAREHWEQGSFQLTYPNPANPVPGSPAIYFQPQILALAVLWAITGWDPALVMFVFGLVAGLAMIRTAIGLYGAVVGYATWAHWVGLGLFVWGGGVLAILGGAVSWLRLGDLSAMFAFDPENGWWFMNLGRNLVFPTETYYHAVFLACAWALVRRAWAIGLALALLLAVSQPFTGISLGAIVAGWGVLERWWLRNRQVPAWVGFGGAGVFAACAGYYLVFLPRFAEHRLLTENWQIPWLYQADAFVPALLLVAGLVAWRLRTARRAATTFSDAGNRLLLVWFLGISLFAHHGFAIDPVVELHFARGYDWMALYLLGAPVLVAGLLALTGWQRQPRRGWQLAAGGLAVVLVGLLFVADNLLWYTQRPVGESVRLSQEQRALFAWLDQPGSRHAVVVSDDRYTEFLATVYSPVHAWAGQTFNTPGYPARRAEVEALFRDGTIAPAMRQYPLYIVRRLGTPRPPAAELSGREPVYRNGAYEVFRLDPA